LYVSVTEQPRAWLQSISSKLMNMDRFAAVSNYINILMSSQLDLGAFENASRPMSGNVKSARISATINYTSTAEMVPVSGNAK
jgi:hypothetical protein